MAQALSDAPRRFARAVLLLAVAFACSGCGSNQAKVTGTITYGTNPVTRGQISFIGSDGQSASGTINADGTYVVFNVPRGEVTVAIVSTAAEGEGKLGAAILPQAPTIKSLIPVRYNDEKSSGLKYTITSSPQKIDIELTGP
jgi:hypothetical protein